eukprot:GEZU01024217.1.p1 GENE.GEZU01024217.1~~GEZU01024217.1.p1  ORF type:complete len:308 (-),score=65.36 GEZU01024217.1:110-1033(-)
MHQFLDLNVPLSNIPNEKEQLKAITSILVNLRTLGYSGAAVNFSVTDQNISTIVTLSNNNLGNWFQTDPCKIQKLAPLPPTNEFSPFPSPLGMDQKNLPSFKLYKRVTIHENVQNPLKLGRNMKKLYEYFDIVSVLPLDEKTFDKCCESYEIDVISLDITSKIGYLRFKNVEKALERGVSFEICYAPSFKDRVSRRYFITNALRLLKITKGKNTIISSGAAQALDVRGPYDVANMGSLFEVDWSSAKHLITTNCRSLLMHAETAKTHKSVFSVQDDKKQSHVNATSAATAATTDTSGADDKGTMDLS